MSDPHRPVIVEKQIQFPLKVCLKNFATNYYIKYIV